MVITIVYHSSLAIGFPLILKHPVKYEKKGENVNKYSGVGVLQKNRSPEYCCSSFILPYRKSGRKFTTHSINS